jgi:hypothetical protein
VPLTARPKGELALAYAMDQFSPELVIEALPKDLNPFIDAQRRLVARWTRSMMFLKNTCDVFTRPRPKTAGWPSQYLPFRGSNKVDQTLASARRPVGYAAGITLKLPTSGFSKCDLAGVEGQVFAGVLRELVMLCCDQW